MPRTSIAVVDSKRLVAIFGPRDQHLRRIRSTLGVGVSARDDSIHSSSTASPASCASWLAGSRSTPKRLSRN